MIQQGVPVYDPQVVAMHTIPLAAHLSSTARGSCLNPDVRIKESTLEMIKRATIGNLFSGITHVPALFLPILTSASNNRGYRKAFANAQINYEL